MPSLVTFVFILVCSVMPLAAGELLTIDHEGLDRKAVIENVGDQPRPLIVFLHSYQNAERHERLRDRNYEGLAWEKLDDLARAQGFAVVYPSSWRGRWAVTPPTDQTRHPQTGAVVDDLGFIDKLIDRLIADGAAVEDQIYLVGRSNGAKLAFHFTCAPDHRFAAFVTLVASIQEDVAQRCDPKAVPYMAIAGTNDRILPYDGWLAPEGRLLSVPETLQMFVSAHVCKAQSWHELPDTVVEDNSTVRLVWWRDCDTPDGSVRLLRVEGAGHTIPRPELGNPKWVEKAGGQNQDIDAAEYIVDFFSGAADLPAAD